MSAHLDSYGHGTFMAGLVVLGSLIATGLGLTAPLLWIRPPLTLLLLLVSVFGMLHLSSRSIARQSSERQRCESLDRACSMPVENALEDASHGPIELPAAPGEHGVTITVTDHGPGIPVQDRQRVFERFVQLDESSTRRRGGTGHGLDPARELAALIGGSPELGDAPGGGARLVLKVPGSAADAHKAGTPEPLPAVRKRPAHLPIDQG